MIKKIFPVLISAVSALLFWHGHALRCDTAPAASAVSTAARPAQSGISNCYAYRQLNAQDRTALRNGINRLYNLNYSSAIDAFKPLFIRRPRHPAPWFYLAMVYWIRYTHYEPTAAIAARFNRYIRIAVYLAQQQLKRNPQDGRMLFYLAGAKGFIGRMAIEQSNWFTAVKNGIAGYSLLKKARQLLPGDPDILFGLGLFEFYSGRAPRLLRPAMRLFGVSGDWHKGLRMLQQSMRSMGMTGYEATFTLSYIYLYELRRYRAANRLLAELHGRFPGNTLLEITLLESRYFLGQRKMALQRGEQLLQRLLKDPAQHRFIFRVYCLLGKICYSAQLNRKGIKYLTAALKTKPALPPSYRYWAKLRRGIIYLRIKRLPAAAKELRSLLNAPVDKVKKRAQLMLRRIKRLQKRYRSNGQ